MKLARVTARHLRRAASRVPLHVVERASNIHPLLPKLLPECGDLDSAQNELRWMREHILNASQSQVSRQSSAADNGSEDFFKAQLESYVDRRSKGEPLQYILGTQPFGDLEILCRPGVLIPRPETETYATTLAKVIAEMPVRSGGGRDAEDQPNQILTITDFCTGSGCIALLLHALLKPPSSNTFQKTLTITGADLSTQALDLAEENKTHNIKLGNLHESATQDLTFERLDVLGLWQQIVSRPLSANETPGQIPRAAISLQTALRLTSLDLESPVTRRDIIVANPPYISLLEFQRGTKVADSVHMFEPRMALVPPYPESGPVYRTRAGTVAMSADIFYNALLDIALASMTKLLVMEIGDNDQADRVRTLVDDLLLSDAASRPEQVSRPVSIETWLDDGSIRRHKDSSTGQQSDDAVSDRAIVVKFGEWDA